MLKPNKLVAGDKVAIVSLSSGMLGEDFCSHTVEIATRRLKEFGLEPVFMPNALKGIAYLQEQPEKRAEDIKVAFLNPEIKGIICAIGGDDTYRLLPYLLEDQEFKDAVKSNPKLFTGFSDTTINHLMFYQLGLQTYYGPNFVCDLGELADEMLPYTKEAFSYYLSQQDSYTIKPSKVWYEEREDFSAAGIGTNHVAHEEIHGFELLQGKPVFEGELLGGCLESLYDILSHNRYDDEQEICEKYHVFPCKEIWKDKILFIETCEEKPKPEFFRQELEAFKKQGVFDVVKGIIVGKPQDEAYYEEYKVIYSDVIDNQNLPIVYNVNFGHALPRTTLPYGAWAKVDSLRQEIMIEEEKTCQMHF